MKYKFFYFNRYSLTFRIKAIFVTNLSIAIWTLVNSSPANAAYYRFWRGEKLATINHSQFETLLNTRLLPGTARLFDRPSGLQQYMPFLFTANQNEGQGFPSEMALLEYNDEATYLTYRATEEGKQYGDLHWEMFEKTRSGSLVPQPYQQAVELEKAYIVKPGLEWNKGLVFVRVYLRDHRFSDTEYLNSIQEHIDFNMNVSTSPRNPEGPEAFILLVAQNYVVEYIQWKSQDLANAAEETAVDHFDPATGQIETFVMDSLAEITAVPVIRPWCCRVPPFRPHTESESVNNPDRKLTNHRRITLGSWAKTAAFTRFRPILLRYKI